MDVWPTRDDAVNMDAANNPFQTNGSEPTYQKASLLLDLAGSEPFKHSAPPSETDLYFLNRPANGKGDASYDDDDFGPETDVDAVDDVLLSPAIAAAKAAAEAAAMDGKQLEADLELQRQQLSAFDPVREPREETPTPPADDVGGGAPLLLPEAENVAESGEESEDEWNYFRVEPTEKPAGPPLPAGTVPETLDDDDEDNMESRLNPNAAEFVPSPTSTKPSMEDLISQSPTKGGISMDDVPVPSLVEFQQEVSLRPSELDMNPFAQNDISGDFLPDLLNGKTEPATNEKNSYQLLENEPDLSEFAEHLNPFKSSDYLFDKSEVSSTKAEYGDDTACSFAGNVSGVDSLKTGEDNLSAFVDLDASMTESEYAAANTSVNAVGDGEPLASEITLIPTKISDELTSCFELQKDLIPIMDAEVIQMLPVNENVCSDINSTPLNQELGLEDLVFPNPILPSVNSTSEYNSAPLDEVLDSTLTLQQGPLSPIGDASSLGINFTEPTMCRFPISTEIQLSSVTSEIQNLVLESHTSDFGQQEISQLSHVQNEPFIPEDATMVRLESVTSSSDDVHNDLTTLSQVQEVIPYNDSAVEILEELHQKELGLVADVQPIVSTEDDKEDSVQSRNAVMSAEGAAAVTLATVGAVAVLSGSKGENKEVNVTAKKPIADKGKVMPAGKSASVPLQKASPKTTPTSPTKPLMPASRSAAAPPKKTAPTTPSRVTSKAATGTVTTKTTTAKPAPSVSATNKVTATSTNQVRVKVGSSSLAKPPTSARPAPTKAAAAPRPRPATATATRAPTGEKKPGLSNGDVKPTVKRSEPPAAKKATPPAATKPPARPATAPVAGRTTKTSTVTRTTTLGTVPAKPAVNGVSKPKTTTTATTLRAKPSSITSKPAAVDKQVKDSANKQISSVAAKTASSTRTAVASTRKPQGLATKTTTTTTVTKSNCGPIKRPTSSTVTKTTTSKIVTAESTGNEMVVVEEITSTVTKDDSPVIDNAHMEVISPTN